MGAAMKRVEEGEDKAKIDAAAEKFGMPMGPIELADTVGLDICKHVSEILGFEVPEDAQIARLVAAGKLGKKAGEGFYRWEMGKPVKRGPPGMTWGDAELERLGRELAEPLIDAAEKCLAEGVVADAEHVDAGVIFGTGFAPFRGGPLHYRASLAGQKSAETGATAVAE
jgi:3-hydroxyacyl-CoA dehydrogenase/enoyl-CoA hydratase/3-hydroxybutyryl-CoA epimerase